MIDPIVNDPLCFRRERPVAYSADEVRVAMFLMGIGIDELASKWSISSRTVRRMRDLGAHGACAAALNAELRLHFYRPQIYAAEMHRALGDSIL